MAERPRTNLASLVLISRLAPFRNSVTSPVDLVTSAKYACLTFVSAQEDADRTLSGRLVQLPVY